ncbi:MAG: RNA-directed DNA polymerase [Gemmatimonadota bacterium]|nr:RNA-directed DNA polymerase [Gemmatimonadota bacterium]
MKFRRQTTGIHLTEDEAFVGLVDYGLFGEKLPPCFSSEGLSNHVPDILLDITKEDDEKKLKKLLRNRGHDFTRYEALREVNTARQIGVPHPESHVVQCLALKRHWAKIKMYCAKPKIPVSRIYVRKTSSKRVFKMNYKGKEYLENEELDIRSMTGAHFVARTDISNCFHSIYTHSIPWVLHGRSKSKMDHSVLLEGNLLDNVTRGTRDGQTNGLLIGPHPSNVISEIVLTRIDHEMIQKGYRRFHRYIDDYTFYAKNHNEAEKFIHDLGMQLREYELVLNGRKTEILPMPLPINEDWVRELNSYRLPVKSTTVHFGTVRSLLDLALKLAHGAHTYAVLNYAIKMVPPNLNSRAKRLFVQEAINLALLYPYLAPILDEHVFDKHSFNGIEKVILGFIEKLLTIGIQRIFPDAIAHALYYSLKHNLRVTTSEYKLRKVLEIDDCLSNVLLLEYAKRHNVKNIRDAIRRRTNKLKGTETRDKDRFWLLIYQMWREKTLRDEGQVFLADLKRSRFNFLSFQ